MPKRWQTPEITIKLSVERVTLNREKLVDSFFGEGEHFIHLFAGEWFALGGALDFDEFAAARADDVHINFGG